MNVLTTLRREQERIMALSRALHYLIETSEDKRQHRAKALLESGAVLNRALGDRAVTGTVKSSSQGRYAVRIEFRSRGSIQTASSDCTCRDARNRVCKHAIALAAEQLLALRDRWTELEKAATVIENINSEKSQCCA